MRLALATLFSFTFSACLVAIVSAVHPYPLTLHEHKRSTDPLASRQYHAPRALIDVCINLNANLLADASKLLGLGSILDSTRVGGNIHLCLCLKDLDLFLTTNTDVQLLVKLLGRNKVAALITALVNTSPNAQQCAFPRNAHHSCDNSDPCHYSCDPPYAREGGQCVCAAPHTTCNGLCGLFPHGCISATPRSSTKRVDSIINLSQAKAICLAHESVCGVPGRDAGLAFDCVNTNISKDSCGGCITPHPFVESEPIHHISGKDCEQIAHSQDTECSNGQCFVKSCDLGWIPSGSGDSCIPEPRGHSKMRKIRRQIEVNSSTVANVDPALLSQLGAIVKIVLGLTSQSPIPTLSASPDVTVSKTLSEIDSATTLLVTSTNIASFLTELEALLSLLVSLKSDLHRCHCGTQFGVSEDLQELTSAILALSNLKDWCSRHPIVPTPSSSPTNQSFNPPDQPILIELSDLLADLGKAGISLGGSGSGISDPVNQLLNLPSPVPSDYDGPTTPPTGDAGLSSFLRLNLTNQIEVVLGLVLKIQTHTIPTANIDPTLVSQIVQLSSTLLRPQNTSSLLYTFDALLTTEGALRTALDDCGCIQTLGLDSIVLSLQQLVDATLALKTQCDAHLSAPVGGSSTRSVGMIYSISFGSVPPTQNPTPLTLTQPSSPSTVLEVSSQYANLTYSIGLVSSHSSQDFTQPAPTPHSVAHTNSFAIVAGTTTSPHALTTDVPIIMGLNGLYDGLGAVSIDGLGNPLSTSVNGILDGLEIGPNEARRNLDGLGGE